MAAQLVLDDGGLTLARDGDLWIIMFRSLVARSLCWKRSGLVVRGARIEGEAEVDQGALMVLRATGYQVLVDEGDGPIWRETDNEAVFRRKLLNLSS
jgi:hypothetical protein